MKIGEEFNKSLTIHRLRIVFVENPYKIICAYITINKFNTIDGQFKNQLKLKN